MSQQFTWGSSSHQQSGRRGIAPISTAFGSQTPNQRPGASSQSPSRASFSPAASAPAPTASSRPSRAVASRASSTSSASTPFSPSQTAAQQQPVAASQLLSSGGSRARNIASSTNPHVASAAAALPNASQTGGGAASSGGGGTAKLARASPSLSQSSGVGSPSTTANPPTAPAGQSLSKIVIAQIFLLLSSLKDDKDKTKWEQQVDQIQKLVESNGMEVYTKYFRRLLQSNAAQLFPGSARSSDSAGAGNYPMLVGEMQKISQDLQQADKIAESLDTQEGDLFRDFDLSTFMEHFKLDTLAKTLLALACKSASKTDLRMKADAILSSTYTNLLNHIIGPTAESQDIHPPFLAAILERLIQDPPRIWTEEQKGDLRYAVRLRFQKRGRQVPTEISSVLSLMGILTPDNPLVRHVQRAGPKATATVDAAKEMLASAESRDIVHQQVANAILFMAISQNGLAYNPGNFIAALREHRAGGRLDWQDVLSSFDREGLRVTKQQFLVLFHALLPLAKDYANFDIQFLLAGTSWRHTETMLSFVIAFLSCSPDELDISKIPRLRVAWTPEIFDDASEETKAYAAKIAKHPFISLDATQALFSTMFRSQETYNQAQLLGVTDNVINPFTDIVLISAVVIPKPWGALQDQALRQLLLPFLKKELQPYDFVMHGIWKQDTGWTIQKLLDYWAHEPMVIHRIFEHAQDHGWMDALLSIHHEMCIDLAAIAHKRSPDFNLEQWAQGILQAGPQEFSRALGSFLDLKIIDEALVQREQAAPKSVGLAVKTVYAFLSILQDHLPEEELVVLQRSCIQTYPRIVNYGEGFDEIIDANSQDGNKFSEETDAKMQDHYKKMYGMESDVRSIIEALQKYKTSEDPADQDLFACMIHGLFDEYNCFGEYPLEALATTAVLFGSIINFNLLSRITLQAGLGMVLEAVQRYPPDESMYKFGLQALLHFKERLHEWPKFCDRLLGVPGLQGTEIWTKAEEVVRSQVAEVNGNGTSGLAMTNGNADEILGVQESPYVPFTCLHEDPPVRGADFYEDPDEEVQDTVLFALNNISERNVQEKTDTLKRAVEDRHHQWFSAYVVDQRAKTQANLHPLYMQMLSLFDDNMLWAEVLRETYGAVIRMLNSESTMNSTPERNNLKNLAIWLGSLTIARDKPIKFKNISFKDLLIEGHDSQRLIIVIPFTCKVLAQGARSLVFTPPNPWIMEILRILMELYHFADLKLNQKFEIEVLCKTLNVDHKDIEPSECIRSRPTIEEEYLGIVPEGLEGFNDLSLVSLNRVRTQNDRYSSASILASLPDFSNDLIYPTSQMMSASRMRNICISATQQALQEIIAPVVERSITIASIATSQMIAKDFATEPDENKVISAAHNLAKSLSGSLGLVTCKEPLRMSITNNIRIIARDLPGGEQAMPEGLILMFVNDNLDLICSLVEHAAENRSLQEIDNQLQDAVEARRAHRMTHPNEPFVDALASRWSTFIPEPYKLAPGGLNAQQLAIYEQFTRQPRSAPSHANNASQDSGRQLPDILQEQFPAVPNLPTPAEAPAVPRQNTQRMAAPPVQTPSQPHINGFIDVQTYIDRVLSLLLELQRAAKEAPEEHIKDLGQSAPTREIYDELVHTMDSAGLSRDNLALACAQKVTDFLFSELRTRLEIEVMVELLFHTCQVSSNTARQVIVFFAGVEEPRLFNTALTVCLLKYAFIDMRRIDGAAAHAIAERNGLAVEFLSDLVDEILLGDNQSALRSDLAKSLEALTLWLNEDPDYDIAKQVMVKLKVMPLAVGHPNVALEKNDLMEYIFEEWIQLYRSDAHEKSLSSFVFQLHDSGILKSSEDCAQFVRICTELSVGAYEQEEASLPYGILDNAYIPIDAFAKLIATLAVYHMPADATPNGVRVRYLDRIMSVLVLVLMNHHQSRGMQHFSQKVFFRMFSSLLCELETLTRMAPDLQMELMKVMGTTFMVLQPNNIQGFSFAWLMLISHRIFMPALLRRADPAGWDLYTQLMESLLNFVGELVKPVEYSAQARDYYRGVLRVLLVLHHDFPEFLAENHFRLCNSIPVHCTQLRNLIVSAYPSSFPELPDPFTAGLKVDRLEEIRKAPIIRGDIERPLARAGIRDAVDSYLHEESNESSMEKICKAVSSPARAETGFAFTPVKVDTVLLNALVLYIGTDALNAPTSTNATFVKSSPHAKLLEGLSKGLRPEGRYHFISAIVNQLRYPNSHTHYFSYALLHIFGSPTNEQDALDVQQQVTRVLLERLLVHRPHPWGLIITLLEILKNPAYQFWDLPFVKTAPEVRSLFDALFQHINQSPRALA
ncbi:CCR4-Not complex component, Not1-domain-containing protein [Lineolata rhizophorae]|uniref:General negative regulator of transcription subunit 1 n=1 Tax=Lineolata rhizophorae TaxID=578093 RepID=A0A6A6P209_9PEZI|nr:CCR4-Not complex component, Not1-domain-containing protein [Lineolata rhizophorae]